MFQALRGRWDAVGMYKGAPVYRHECPVVWCRHGVVLMCLQHAFLVCDRFPAPPSDTGTRTTSTTSRFNPTRTGTSPMASSSGTALQGSGGANGREGFSAVTSLQRVAERPKARHGCQLYCSAAAGGTQGLYCMSSSSTAGAQARPSLRHNRPQDVRYARAARQREPDLLPGSNWEWTSNWLVLPGAKFTPVAPFRDYDDAAVGVHMQW